MAVNLENDKLCFCCGENNERGLRVKFLYPAEGQAETSVMIPGYFTGWQKMVHGGLLGMLLDEAMAHACISGGARALTAEMTVRYLKPLGVGTTIRVVGKVEEIRGKLLKTSGLIYDSEGRIAAEGVARFVKV